MNFILVIFLLSVSVDYFDILIFFSFCLVDHLSKEIEAKPRLTTIHLVTSHMYPLPISLLQLKYGSAATVHFTNSTRYVKKYVF